MAEIIVKVPDGQVSFFLSLLKKLGYTTDSNAPKIEQWHIDIVEERMREYKKNPYPMQDANEAIDDILKDI